jgi:hypothetical protein
MKNAPLIISVVLNVVLIICLVALHSVSKQTAFQAVADAAAAEVRLQEHILAELESGDTTRLDKVKGTLKRNIENGKKAAADWRNAANR